MHIGTQIALKFHTPASSCIISRKSLETLRDLLDAIAARWPDEKQLLGMLRSTAAHISICLGKPPEQLKIDECVNLGATFKAYLLERRFKHNSARAYVNYLRILTQKALELGWKPPHPEVAESWQEILSSVSKVRGCRRIVKHAINMGKHPADFTDQDLDHWAAQMLAEKFSYKYVRGCKSSFRRLVIQNGLSPRLPRLQSPAKIEYGVPLSDFPEPLRTDVDNLLKWKVAEFSPGRPQKFRFRQCTADGVRNFISRIFGFLRNVQGKVVRTLEELLSKDSLSAYLEWCINVRHLRTCTLSSKLVMIHAAVKRYPQFKERGKEFGWISELISELPVDSAVSLQERKNKKWVSYDELSRIPEKIRNEVTKNTRLSVRAKALMVRNELIITWLTTQPWRQRNLRECKLGRREDGANLFKEEIPPFSIMARPHWVNEQLKADPHAKFWQFYFRPNETKAGHPVQGILPRPLIPILERYLESSRSLLTSGNDVQTLFVNAHGRPLRSEAMCNLVEDITSRYTGRRMNPHLFRDAFALAWLEAHPEDYLTLSKILWHRNVNVTLRVYGRNFDESHGAVRAEEWLEARIAAQKKELPQCK